MSFIGYLLTILNKNLLFFIDIFVGCMLDISLRKSYIQGVRLRVSENLEDDSWSRNKTKIVHKKNVFSAKSFSYRQLKSTKILLHASKPSYADDKMSA